MLFLESKIQQNGIFWRLISERKMRRSVTQTHLWGIFFPFLKKIIISLVSTKAEKINANLNIKVTKGDRTTVFLKSCF